MMWSAWWSTTHQSDFETKTETAFNDANKKASADNLSNNLSKNYKSLLNTIHSEKLKELDKNKVEILNNLTEEIVKRYYYEEGVYQQKTVFDTTILKAVSILNNSNEYNKLLKN